MQFDRVKEFILNKLKSELPRYLAYHNMQHTLDVLGQVEILATQERLSIDELTLLRTAALFHDSGFLQAYKGHEEISCKIAETYLPEFEYSKDQISRICDMILATSLPQQPKTKMSEILCDADLSFLGLESYASKAENLYQEMYAAGLIHGREEWMHDQIRLLHGHHYFTPLAEKQFAPRLQKNLAIIQEELQSHKSVTGHKEFHFSDIIQILVGVMLATYGLKSFLVPNHFFDGGVTGISLLISHLTKTDLAYVILLANLPFIVMGFYIVGARFALKTLVSIILLGVCLIWVPFTRVTVEPLLVSVFGGFFLGVGIGLTMRAGCAIDGIEVLALYTWRRTSFTISEIIMALNIIIFCAAAFETGPEKAFYSMLTYFIASKTIDYVIEGIEAYTGVTIISGRSEIIKERMVNELGRAITIYKGERGFLPGKYNIHNECDILFTVITRLELRKLKRLVNDIDANAFVFANTIREASGGILKRRHIQ